MAARRFLVTNFRGSSFRLLDLDTKEQFRALESMFPDMVPGTLLRATNVATEDTLITRLEVEVAVVGDASKPRQVVETKKTRIGDLVDGVPVMRLGPVFYDKGVKKAYAYFKPSFGTKA